MHNRVLSISKAAARRSTPPGGRSAGSAASSARHRRSHRQAVPPTSTVGVPGGHRGRTPAPGRPSFSGLAADLQAKRDRLVPGLVDAGFEVYPRRARTSSPSTSARCVPT
ncbi:MAG: hypothetical protein R2713_10475 [Ilumatobacteraceae bacterium]